MVQFSTVAAGAAAISFIFQAAGKRKGGKLLEDPLPFSLHIILQNFQTQQQERLQNEVFQPIDHVPAQKLVLFLRKQLMNIW